MLEFLPTADDVIALLIAHKITGEDLDAIMDRLEPIPWLPVSGRGPCSVRFLPQSVIAPAIASNPG